MVQINMIDSLNKHLSLRISERQEKILQKFEELTGIKKTKIGYLGIEAILMILDDMLKESGNDEKFFNISLREPKWFRAGALTYKPLIESLPINEKMQFKIMIESQKNKQMKGGEKDE